jgi:hypothetical protein
MNNELESMWKEAVIAQFNVLSRNLSGGTGEYHENLSQDSQLRGEISTRYPSNTKQ